MSTVFKYLTIIITLICLFQTCLFAQLEGNYVNMDVKVTLKNGRMIEGKIVSQTDEGITLEIANGAGNVTFYKNNIEQIVAQEENISAKERNYSSIPSGVSIEYRFRWGCDENFHCYPVVELRTKNNSDKEIESLRFKVLFITERGKEVFSEVTAWSSNMPPRYSTTTALVATQGVEGYQFKFGSVPELSARVYINDEFIRELRMGDKWSTQWFGL